MAINQNHLFEELNGVKCAIVEKHVVPGRVAFLRGILEFNGYTVVVVASPPPKAALGGSGTGGTGPAKAAAGAGGAAGAGPVKAAAASDVKAGTSEETTPKAAGVSEEAAPKAAGAAVGAGGAGTGNTGVAQGTGGSGTPGGDAANTGGTSTPVVNEVPPPPETFTVGVTDVVFNPINAIFGRLLKAPGGHVVTLAFWKQQDAAPDDERPYFAEK